MIHGGSIQRITNIDELAYRAGMNVISKIDPAETRRITNLVNPVHRDIYDYALPTDFKKIADLRPQVNRTMRDNFFARFSKDFDLRKRMEDRTIQIKDTDANRTIRINFDISPSPIVINSMDSLTGNGTWGAVGTAANLSVNSLFFISGSNSIEFDLLASGDGLENTTMTAQDLSEHDEISELFVWVYVNDASLLTSVTMLWGNDLTANFWTGVAATTQFDGTAFRNGWNLCKFSWDVATETGTVDPSLIDSIRVTVASTAQNNVRIDHVTSSIGKIFEIEYYSKFLWRTAAGVYKATPSEDDDILNLDEPSYNIYLNELGLLASQQNQGADAGADIAHFRTELYGGGTQIGLYETYSRDFPSEEVKKQGIYYKIPRGRRRPSKFSRG